MRAEGVRKMHKQGLRFANRRYYTRGHALLSFIGSGEDLEVRVDPADLSRVYVWRQEPIEFIGIAECLDEMAPADKAALTCEGGAKQRKHFAAERRSLKRLGGQRDALTGAMEVLGHNFARNHSGKVVPLGQTTIVPHSTPALDAAARAARSERYLPPPPTEAEIAAQAAFEAEAAQPIPIPDTLEQRFDRAIRLERRLAAGETVGHAEVGWLEIYQRTPEYQSQREMLEEFGDQLLLTA